MKRTARNSGKVIWSLLAAILVAGLAGWRLKAVSTVYFTQTNFPSNVSGAWDNAAGTDITLVSNQTIPDGTNASEGEVSANIGPCSWNQFTGSVPANMGLEWNGANATGYRVSVQKNCSDPSATTYLNAYDHGGGTGYWQLMSVQLPELPQNQTLTGFIRHNGFYPGITVRLPYMNLEWIISSASVSYTGKPGLNAGFSGQVDLATIDRDTPPVPSTGQITTTRWPYSIDMAWPAQSGVYRCNLLLNGSYVGNTKGTSYTFGGLTPSTSYTLGIQCLNKHWTASAVTTTSVSTTAVSTQSSQTTPRRVGVSKYAATWGGMGEAIDTLSGNLNYSATIASPVVRAAGEVPFGLTYNSQLWLADNTGWKTMSGDLGFGYGWRMLAGAVTPVWVDSNTFSHYIFTDASGAEYRLDQYASGLWKSKEGFYGYFEPGTRKIKMWFPNGTQWEMNCTSGSPGRACPATRRT